jgi:hypothetical protein
VIALGTAASTSFSLSSKQAMSLLFLHLALSVGFLEAKVGSMVEYRSGKGIENRLVPA